MRQFGKVDIPQEAFIAKVAQLGREPINSEQSADVRFVDHLEIYLKTVKNSWLEGATIWP